MKKTLFLSLAAALLLTACGSESTIHVSQFDRSGVELYADQTADTVGLTCADDWTLTVATDGSGWLTADPESFTMPREYALCTVPVALAAGQNQTGRLRFANLYVRSYQQAGITVYQHPFIHIEYPAPTFYDAADMEQETNYAFTTEVSDTATRSFVIFRNCQDGATLVSEADWLTLEENAPYAKGRHQTWFRMTRNEADEPRTATLRLTSGDITNVIEIKQRKHATTE